MRPIDKTSEALLCHYNGALIRAFAGENLAAALFAGGHTTLSRSLKYHRPRGMFCMDGHCGRCLVRVDGIPNVRACMHLCQEGTQVESQNALPTANSDLFEVVDLLFPKGMDHHRLMTGIKPLSAITHKVVRQMSGLGELPAAPARPAAVSTLQEVDVLVIGGGPAGLKAAAAAANQGAKTLLVDEGLHLGGSLRTDPRFGRAAALELVDAVVQSGAQIAAQTCAIAHSPEEGALTVCVDSQRLLRIRATVTVHATGSYAQNIAFANNDRPGVIALRAASRLLLEYGITPAESICVVGQSGLATAVIDSLRANGSSVSQIDQSREKIVNCRGDRQGIHAAIIEDSSGQHRELPCQLIVIAATPAPASELARQQSAIVQFSEASGGFALCCDEEGRCQTENPSDVVFACGDVCGYMGPAKAMSAGENAGLSAARTALSKGAISARAISTEVGIAET